jgi:hypothetical protein
MSWLARLLGRAPAASAEQAAATVVVPQDLADRLTVGGASLTVAVESALRDHLAEAERVASQGGDGAKPFWLTRDEERSGDLEERLRDRIAQRRSSEGEAER